MKIIVSNCRNIIFATEPESPLYASDFCWYARHLSFILVLPFFFFAKALQLNVLTGYLFGIGFLIFIDVLSHLLILLVKKNVEK
jgi:hypothetical protein